MLLTAAGRYRPNSVDSNSQKRSSLLRDLGHNAGRRNEANWKRQRAEAIAKREEIGKKVVEIYDVNKSGKMESEQVAAMLRDMNQGKEATEDEMEYVMGVCDATEDGCIDHTEALLVYTTWLEYLKVVPEVEPILDKYDENFSGRLEKHELLQMLQDLNQGRPVESDVLDWVLEEADLDGNGVISKPEIKRVLTFWAMHIQGGSAVSKTSSVKSGGGQARQAPRKPDLSKAVTAEDSKLTLVPPPRKPRICVVQ